MVWIPVRSILFKMRIKYNECTLLKFILFLSECSTVLDSFQKNTASLPGSMTLANQEWGRGRWWGACGWKQRNVFIPLLSKSQPLDVWGLVREVSWEYTIHSSVSRAGDLSKSLSKEIGLGLLVWKIHAQNSVSYKNVDVYNQIYEVLRKKKRERKALQVEWKRHPNASD